MGLGEVEKDWLLNIELPDSFPGTIIGTRKRNWPTPFSIPFANNCMFNTYRVSKETYQKRPIKRDLSKETN